MIGARRSIRAARVLGSVAIVAVAASAVAFGLSTAGAASAEAAASTQPVVLVSTDGVTFETSLSVGIFADAGLMVPGDTVVEHLWIKNPLTTPATVRVNVGNIATSQQAFADNMLLTAFNSANGNSVSETWDKLGQCDVLVQPTTIKASSVIKVTLSLAMLNVREKVAQAQSGSMVANVQMRDAAAGSFPASRCDPASINPGDPGSNTGALPPGHPILGYTGEPFPTQLLLLGGILIGIGWFLLVARKRRKQAEAKH